MNPSRTGIMLLLIGALLGYAELVRADGPVVVVMNGTSDVAHLTREEVINIFLGRFRQLPGGLAAVPIDHPQDSDLMADFYRLLVDKDPAEIRAYWSRLIFSGKTSPPRQAKSEQDLLQWLSETPGAIGYMRPQARSPRLKAVLTLGE